MPRKPKPPPVFVLDIQGLSGSAPKPVDAQALDPGTFVDDWGVVQKYAPQVVEQAQVQAQRIRTREQLKQAAIAKHVQTIEDHRKGTEEFIRKRMQPTLRSPAKAGEQSIKLSGDLVIIVPAKPWRRV